MTYLALLRAVNLGGRNMVSMASLRDLFTALGFEDPRTLLQSGNVVFRGARRPTAALEQTLQAATADRLGVATDYIVRTAKEWNEMIAANPFPGQAERAPHHLLLTALRDRPAAAAVEELQAVLRGGETMRVIGRHAYIVYAEGIGTSRLTNAVIEKRLATRATGRNWNTVLKLAAMTAE